MQSHVRRSAWLGAPLLGATVLAHLLLLLMEQWFVSVRCWAAFRGVAKPERATFVKVSRRRPEATPAGSMCTTATALLHTPPSSCRIFTPADQPVGSQVLPNEHYGSVQLCPLLKVPPPSSPIAATTAAPTAHPAKASQSPPFQAQRQRPLTRSPPVRLAAPQASEDEGSPMFEFRKMRFVMEDGAFRRLKYTTKLPLREWAKSSGYGTPAKVSGCARPRAHSVRSEARCEAAGEHAGGRARWWPDLLAWVLRGAGGGGAAGGEGLRAVGTQRV